MKVFIGYTIIQIIFVLIFIYALGYKKSIFKSLDKKEHPGKSFYGISALVLDIIEIFYKINYEAERTKIGKVYTKYPTKKDVYISIISQIHIAIIVFYVMLTVGYIKCSYDTFSKEDMVTEIDRPGYGEQSKNYNLTMNYDGNSEEIDFTVEPRKCTEDEARQLFTDNYERVVEKLLGDNNSIDNVTEDLNFISDAGKNIGVSWEIAESEYIDYSGKIKWENINDSHETEVTAIMSLGAFSQSYKIRIILNKKNRNKKYLIEDDIERQINNVSENSNKINLKEVMEDYNVVFSKKKEKGSLIYIFFAILMSCIVYIAKRKDFQKNIDDRKDQLEADYAGIVSKLTILQNSGMTLLSAWEKIIEDYEKSCDGNKRFAYEEMKLARNLMESGYSEAEAYLEFGRRCGTHSYIKFANLLEQNIRKGTKGLKEILNQEVREAFEERKALARKKGDEAGTKLLIPMGMMLVISILIIIVPAILSMNF